ncbi:MAG: hypothetical protein R3C11_15480 [Planctomycetaceae bacterium]
MIKTKKIDWQYVYERLKPAMDNDSLPPFPDPECRIKDIPKEYQFDISQREWAYAAWGVPSEEFDEFSTLRNFCNYVAQHAVLPELDWDDSSAPKQVEDDLFEILKMRLEEFEGTEEIKPDTPLESIDAVKLFKAISPIFRSLPVGINCELTEMEYEFNWTFREKVTHFLRSILIAIGFPAWLLWLSLKLLVDSFRQRNSFRALSIIFVPLCVSVYIYFQPDSSPESVASFLLLGWILLGIGAFYFLIKTRSQSKLARLKAIHFKDVTTVGEFCRVLQRKIVSGLSGGDVNEKTVKQSDSLFS